MIWNMPSKLISCFHAQGLNSAIRLRRILFYYIHRRSIIVSFSIVATLPWEIKNSNCLQIFSRYGKCKQIAFLSLLALLFIHTFWYFRCQDREFGPILIANKIFCVTVLLLVYFCDQSVVSEICHSGRHYSVCQQPTMIFSDEDKILIKKHINTLSIHNYARRRIKIGALKMQFLCVFLYLLNICRKFEFSISQGSVATFLKWGG